MRIERAVVTSVRLPLRQPLSTARGEISERDGVLLALHAEGRVAGSLVGWGEASPLEQFETESIDRCEEAVELLARVALGRELTERDEILDAACQRVPDAPCARAGLDAALADLCARTAEQSLAAWLAGELGGVAEEAVDVNALLSADSPEDLVRAAKQAVDGGYRTLKLKIGGHTLERDLERVAAVRRGAGPDARLRVDANGAWDEAGAGAALARLAEFDLEFVEQPIAVSGEADMRAMARIRADAPVEIAADEAARDDAALESLLSNAAVDRIVVKPAYVGGLREASRMVRRARKRGVPVVVTSFLDSALGVSSALHFAAAIARGGQGSRLAAGLATTELFSADLASLPPVVGGRMSVPTAPGLGLVPDPQALSRLGVGPIRELRA